uniref:Papilin, proteoglycan like sulfated glycoprotein n=1 Tax=Ursus maritimus TaxID=29073 RepID=A0A452TUX8_URSMA
LQRCAAWSAEPWGECSVSCGAGVRRRSVTCQSDEGSLLHATACSSEDRPPITEPCVREDCPPIHDQAWHVGAWGLCSKSCSGGTRRRQVICALGPPSRCRSLQLSRPREVEPCNTQPCHLPPEVPSTQDVHASPRDPRMSLGPHVAPTSDSRDHWWLPQEQPSVQGNPRGAQGLHLPGLAPSLPQSPHRQPLRSGLAPQDCRHSPYGCCPDGHTTSLGPQWQGCPGASCQQSRYGCCPDGVSVAEGPHHAGCAGSYNSDSAARRRPGSRAVASSASEAHQSQAQQNEPSECRGSQFGCCYDNVASAAGPLGEGCVGQPSYAYPVQCLLPSAHGSCTDWAARHGNGNNFASEEECVSSCGGPQPAPRGPEPGASGQSTRIDGAGGSPGGQQEAGWHRTGTTVQTKPWPSGGLWRRDQEPGPREESHSQVFGGWPWGGELGPSAPGLGGDAGRPAPPSHSSSYRVSLAGLQPSLVQAARGQLVRLFCQDDTSLEPHARWQKDGQPISSDRHKPQPDGSLVISPLRAEDAGIYSCGSSRPGRDSQKIQLRGDVAVLSEAVPRHFPQTRFPAQGHSPRDSSLVGDRGSLWASSLQPRPTTRLLLDRNQPGVVDAQPGQRIRLTCRAEGFPPPAIEWQRDGQPLSSPRHQLQPDGSLVISHVAVEDSGFYACVAFSGQDRDQRWVQLRVLGKVAVLRRVSGLSQCLLPSRNGLPVRADGHRVHQSPDGTLLIHKLQARDEGSYTCSAYRGSQAVSRSTEVKVIAPALPTQPRDLSRECVDRPELANCDLILQAQLCGNEYYASFCCASCSRFQPPAQPVWQQAVVSGWQRGQTMLHCSSPPHPSRQYGNQLQPVRTVNGMFVKALAKVKYDT